MFLVTVDPIGVVAAPSDINAITGAAVDLLFLVMEFTWDDEADAFRRHLADSDDAEELAAETAMCLAAVGCTVITVTDQ